MHIRIRNKLSVIVFAFLFEMFTLGVMFGGNCISIIADSPIELDGTTRRFFQNNVLLLEREYPHTYQAMVSYLSYDGSDMQSEMISRIMAHVEFLLEAFGYETDDYCRFSGYVLFLEKTKIRLSAQQKKAIAKLTEECFKVRNELDKKLYRSLNGTYP